ncbi:uncharacterized protein LOC113279857 [Papaver somniferum]|uniref:uncharacterized protein LOC113279857 n=1 Tax=Papaver somniferum TaxID=3469 RepID=UPI000E6F6985|nr:uncharacterized protein LOC113279857 [Papaver somniferum]
MAIKLDMSKSFDRIEWNFLDVVLKKLGFHKDWCRMIYECVSTVSASVLLNSAPGYQNDKGWSSNKSSFFADDCVIFTKANNPNARQLESIIKDFSIYSGQSINFDKSGFAFNPKLDNSIKVSISDLLNIKKLALSDKYLGVPLLIQKNKTETFSHLEDEFHRRLAVWKGKYVNQPGRTVMTQSVLGSLASHHLVVFPMPKKLTDRLDGIQMNFWWNKSKEKRGIYLKKFDDVTKPKVLGGLGLKKTADINVALLVRLAWRMLHEPDAHWVKILENKYFIIPILCIVSM